MLSIYIGKDWDAVVSIDVYFNSVYYKEWFDEDIVKQIVFDIDGTEIKGQNLAISKWLGAIPPTQISGGAKACILLLKGSELPIDLVSCGENCIEWIAKISTMVDRRATLSGCNIVFEDTMQFDVFCENNQSVIKTKKEWLRALADYDTHCERNVREMSWLKGTEWEKNIEYAE